MLGYTLEEVSSKGYVVGLPFSLNSNCEPREISGSNENITGLICVDGGVSVSFVASNKTGILEYGYTPVSPRSYEMIIQVTGLPLTKEDSHIRLNMGFLFSRKTATVDGDTVTVKRDGKDDLYGVVSRYAYIDGKRVKVDFDIKSVGGIGIPGFLVEGINAAFGDYSHRLVVVDFPAGVTNFIYNSAVGAGSNAFHASASTTALSFFVVFISIIALMLF